MSVLRVASAFIGPPFRKNDRHTKQGTAIRLCLFAMRMQLGVGRATPQNKEPSPVLCLPFQWPFLFIFSLTTLHIFLGDLHLSIVFCQIRNPHTVLTPNSYLNPHRLTFRNTPFLLPYRWRIPLTFCQFHFVFSRV